jgi:DNA-binding response OmpR family regulator
MVLARRSSPSEGERHRHFDDAPIVRWTIPPSAPRGLSFRETRMSQHKPFIVLYVEDEDSARFFMYRAFIEVAPSVELRTVVDGKQALDYLAGQGGYHNRHLFPLPSLVLLDLNLPQISGFQVLGWMRQHPQFKTTTVVVFSSSDLSEDRVKAHALGADDYVAKPASGSHFPRVVLHLTRRWSAD